MALEVFVVSRRLLCYHNHYHQMEGFRLSLPCYHRRYHLLLENWRSRLCYQMVDFFLVIYHYHCHQCEGLELYLVIVVIIITFTKLRV